MISLVTGGTGYLGGRLVEALLEGGDEVRVLHRPTSDVSRLSGAVTLVAGDITHPESLLPAAEGCDRVFHAAALVKTWVGDPSRFDRVNVEGTLHVCQATRKLGCRLVYTSSFFALGPTGPDAVNEDRVRSNAPYCTDYERTKTLAEERVRRRIGEGLDGVILYPGLVYGPGPLTQGNTISILVRDFLRGRVPGIPGSGQQKWTFSHIGDVVRGHLAAASQAPSGGRYILGGPVASVEETFQILGRLTGKDPPRIHVPIPFLKAWGFWGEQLARLTGHPPTFTRGVAETYRHHWAYDSSKAFNELGYRWKPLEEGMREVVEYLKGFLK